MGSKVISMGSTFRLINEEDVKTYSKLPAKTYTVGFNELQHEYFLTPIENFVLPDRLYGNTERDANRIIRTFQDRENSTGVHLNGIKGSGKTLLAKQVSYIGRELYAYPTIVVNQPYHGDTFNKFFQAINTPCVVIFDEFEKVYDWDNQDKILTLLDGVYPTRMLFIVTSNDSGRISQYMRNRPGRIYYSMTFNSLSVDFVREYCNENLTNLTHIESIVKYVSAYTFFSFDMLDAVVEEMNRYNENLVEVLDFLNIEPESGEDDTYTVSLNINNDLVVIDTNLKRFEPNKFQYDIWPSELDGRTITEEQRVYISTFCGDNDRRSSEDDAPAISDDCVEVRSEDFTTFDPDSNTFTYVVQRGMRELKVQVTRNQRATFSYQRYIV